MGENGLIMDDLLIYDEDDMNSVIDDCKITAHAYKKKFKNAVRKLQFESSKKSSASGGSGGFNQVHRIVISVKESETMKVLESKLADIGVAIEQNANATDKLLEDTQKMDTEIETAF